MPADSAPNVLFIMADQMKASILRMYSPEIGIETPTLERLAEQGVRFEHAITPHPLCVPARTSVMTGRYPHSTGCRRNETLMPENEQHAFRIWKNNGFTTGLIGKNHCFIEWSDLELFDVRCEISHGGLPAQGIFGDYKGEALGNTGMEWVVPEDDITTGHHGRKTLSERAQSRHFSYSISDGPEEHFGTSVIASQTEAFLAKYAEGDFSDTGEPDPFALWVSFPDPHEPYEVPRRYAEMFPPEDVVLPPQRTDEYTDGTSPERNRVLARMMRQTDDPEEHRRGVVSVYQAMTRYVDAGIRRILDKLDELGLRKNTIVVFTADHGDFGGEHGMAVKGGVFYDALVQVPLIVSWPEGGVPQGMVDDSMTSTIDILPTLLELQGLASFDGIGTGWARNGEHEGSALNEAETRRMQGRPLPTVTSAPPRMASFSEYGTGGPPVTMELLDTLEEPLGYHTIIETLWAREAEGRRKMVRTPDWKYVTDPMARGATLTSGSDGGPGDVDELYDLAKDPWELKNVAHLSENAGVISEMRSLLAGWMIDTEDPQPVELPDTVGRSIPVE
ncbi:MAG: sulfatase-like hydrolase/transferase [Dehalococcoidia bacterium]|nr:sulfatase-like hydrolase/transferase [Dehalococcoidia bacterium]